MYLSDKSLDVEIISSKSSEMNVLIPKGNSGDYVSFIYLDNEKNDSCMFVNLQVEKPIPEQFKTKIEGGNLNTICVESLG